MTRNRGRRYNRKETKKGREGSGRMSKKAQKEKPPIKGQNANEFYRFSYVLYFILL